MLNYWTFFFLLLLSLLQTARAVEEFGGTIEDLLMKFNKNIVGKIFLKNTYFELYPSSLGFSLQGYAWHQNIRYATTSFLKTKILQ